MGAGQLHQTWKAMFLNVLLFPWMRFLSMPFPGEESVPAPLSNGVYSPWMLQTRRFLLDGTPSRAFQKVFQHSCRQIADLSALARPGEYPCAAVSFLPESLARLASRRSAAPEAS